MAPLSPELLLEFREAFAHFDKDNDGILTTADLGTAMRSLGQTLSEEELQRMIHDVDLADSGGLDFEEFVHLMGRRVSGSDEDTKYAFSVFDTDKTGRIRAHNLHQAMGTLGEAVTLTECQAMIAAADTDGKGYVTLDTFKNMLMVKAPGGGS